MSSAEYLQSEERGGERRLVVTLLPAEPGFWKDNGALPKGEKVSLAVEKYEEEAAEGAKNCLPSSPVNPS